MELCKGVEEDECQVVAVQEEIQDLLYDAVYEVLSRVTLVNLLRQCQWVCKDWQKLILFDTQFQKKNLQNTPSLGPGCLVYDHVMEHIKFAPYVDCHQEHKSPMVSSPFLDFLPKSANDITIACASQFGSLLCCVTRPKSSPIPSYHICKTATREWRKIPNLNTSLGSFPKVRIGIAVAQSRGWNLRYFVYVDLRRDCDITVRCLTPPTGLGRGSNLSNLLIAFRLNKEMLFFSMEDFIGQTTPILYLLTT
ncbi:uncharacterized protein LOC113294682 [Papaver somniferum]|uniref:uncharacterized protein LOC113294682 n=1 Tax=Papaver somniferum TaxID=3469 RepID=UPI000E6F4D9F|nr:uncharacterized protein LOC113294682 [Papaver somniferum]